MKKLLKKLNNSVGITFSKEERTIHDLHPGDIIDIELTKEDEE